MGPTVYRGLGTTSTVYCDDMLTSEDLVHPAIHLFTIRVLKTARNKPWEWNGEMKNHACS